MGVCFKENSRLFFFFKRKLFYSILFMCNMYTSVVESLRKLFILPNRLELQVVFLYY
jgi:hypothetical protein